MVRAQTAGACRQRASPTVRGAQFKCASRQAECERCALLSTKLQRSNRALRAAQEERGQALAMLYQAQAEDVRGGAQRPAEASPSRPELTRRHSAKAAQELAAAKAEASDLREQVASLFARAELLETKHAAREAELRQRLVASEGKSSRLQLALQSSGAHGRASREEHEQAKRAAEEARRAQEHAVSCDLERLAASLVETEERLRRSEEERERTASEVLSAREEADQAARALGEASEARARLEAQSKDRILELATTKAAIEAEHVAQVASLQKRHEAELEIEVHKAVRRAEAEAQAAAAAVAAETEAAAARRHAEDLLGSVRVAVLAPCVRLVVNDHEALRIGSPTQVDFDALARMIEAEVLARWTRLCGVPSDLPADAQLAAMRDGSLFPHILLEEHMQRVTEEVSGRLLRMIHA
ncbi:hypothetical protein EMIHUDRAFT_354726, partial [Emiliania huxleyi CCMP1516]